MRQWFPKLQMLKYTNISGLLDKNKGKDFIDKIF